jgi:hypothetical protein
MVDIQVEANCPEFYLIPPTTGEFFILSYTGKAFVNRCENLN